MIKPGNIIADDFSYCRRGEGKRCIRGSNPGESGRQMEISAQCHEIDNKQRDKNPEAACRTQTDANGYPEQCFHNIPEAQDLTITPITIGDGAIGHFEVFLAAFVAVFFADACAIFFGVAFAFIAGFFGAAAFVSFAPFELA